MLVPVKYLVGDGHAFALGDTTARLGGSSGHGYAVAALVAVFGCAMPAE